MIHDPSHAQDPRELFDVVTSSGEVTGIAKPRSDVHRDGDWHRSIHVWVTGFDEHGPFLTFQRRNLNKDTWPGKLDATVGGHYRSGESLEQALREVDEEIGIIVDFSDLRFIGKRIAVSEVAAGIKDREIQDVFLLRDERPLTGFLPNPAELSALVQFRLDELLDFLAGMTSSVGASSISAGEGLESRIVVTAEDFITQIDQYYYRVAIAAERFLKGEIHIAV